MRRVMAMGYLVPTEERDILVGTESRVNGFNAMHALYDCTHPGLFFYVACTIPHLSNV